MSKPLIVPIDVEDKDEIKEDASKLYQISNDNTYLFIRNASRKGVKILSLSDTTLVGETPNIHTNPIL